MNRLKKIFSFVLCLSFALLLNVSYAEFNDTPIAGSGDFVNVKSLKVYEGEDYTYTINGVEVSYTTRQIHNIVSNYINNPNNSDYASLYNNMLSYFKNDLECDVIFGTRNNNYLYFYFWEKTSPVSVGYSLGWNQANPETLMTGSTGTGHVYGMTCPGTLYYKEGDVEVGRISGVSIKDIVYSSVNVKDVKYVNNVGFTWDGTSYYYEASFEEPEEPDTPTPPSNSEIAQAVQNFYNSDYYKNNKDFEDFIVMYNYETKYFDFIGHNFGNKLGQQIIDADISIGYPPVSYNERWWRYTLPDEFLTTLFNKYYWLYSTNDFGENIKYEGKGSINDLLDLHFATSSIIVYSTTDYPVNTVFKNENDEMESSADVMPGNHYTYNEKLDPTTNEYDPLTNFIPTDPSQNIMGNVDFNEINKVFEENKNILNIENASWLFTANNQLVNYFIGFLSFLIVLIIISRLLGG